MDRTYGCPLAGRTGALRLGSRGTRRSSTSPPTSCLRPSRLTWSRPDGSAGELRADVFAFLGHIAEPSTFVQEHVDGDEVLFDVATGITEGQSRFRGHGHLVQLRIRRVDGRRG